MPEGRGKKTKKARWQLVLGVKQVLCGVLGLTWMMVIIFILGVMAGRGDIYRWFSSWGLVNPGPANVAQWSPPPETPVVAAAAKSSQPEPGAKPAAPPAPSTSTPATTPITGSIAPTSSRGAPPPAKKTRKGFSNQDYKKQQADLDKLRKEMAKKLVFQNSVRGETSKSLSKAHKKPGKAATGQKRPVRVAQFRNLKDAQARLAALQQKGEKVTLKKGKDKKGAYYDIYREAPATQTQAAAGLVQKGKKADVNHSNRQTGVRN